MTTISARVVADSVSNEGIRLTTLEARYPRIFCHADVLTHREFSRNGRSGRAVPARKIIDEVIHDPVIPLYWSAAQKGMVADNETDEYVDLRTGLGTRTVGREAAWLYGRDCAVSVAESYLRAGYGKQIVNRIVEVYSHIDVVITSTNWNNFDILRDHRDAEPHMQLLAQAMKKARSESEPKLLNKNEWHLPYISKEEKHEWSMRTLLASKTSDGQPPYIDILRKMSVARCARVSIRPFDGVPNVDKDMDLAERLLKDKHYSPFEHVAQPDTYISDKALVKEWRRPQMSRNFIGWNQYRAMIGG